MNCQVILTAEAQNNLTAIKNPVLREQIIKKVDILAEYPESGKPLCGILSGYRSLRAARNRYRIIYKFLRNEDKVVVIAIGIRKGDDFSDVYRSLERIIKRVKVE